MGVDTRPLENPTAVVRADRCVCPDFLRRGRPLRLPACPPPGTLPLFPANSTHACRTRIGDVSPALPAPKTQRPGQARAFAYSALDEQEPRERTESLRVRFVPIPPLAGRGETAPTAGLPSHWAGTGACPYRIDPLFSIFPRPLGRPGARPRHLGAEVRIPLRKVLTTGAK